MRDIEFLRDFMSASDAYNIHEGPAMWLIKQFLTARGGGAKVEDIIFHVLRP